MAPTMGGAASTPPTAVGEDASTTEPVLVAASRRGLITIWSMQDSRQLRQYPTLPCTCIIADPAVVVVGSASGCMHVHELLSGTVIRELRWKHESAVKHLALDRDQNLLVSGTSGTVRVFRQKCTLRGCH
jgi:WD40 repeat protein